MNPAKRKKIYRASLAQVKKEEVKVEAVVVLKAAPVVEAVKEQVVTESAAIEVNVPLVIIAEEQKEATVEEKATAKKLKK